MNAVPLLPENAPFPPAQRAWLNGFFAGLISRAAATMGSAPANVAAALSAPTAAPALAEEETFPWHDAALGLDERMKLVEGKPMARQLMAAMAQLDCGACGYLCQSYGEAIAAGTEKDLGRCAPGGRDTSKKLKELIARNAGAAGGANAVVLPGEVKKSAVNGKSAYSRLNPCPAPLLVAEPLNKAGSTKDTRLVAFDLSGTGLKYEVGDALGVYPQNCPDAVQWLLDALDVSGTEKVSAPEGTLVTLRDALTRHYCISKPSQELASLLATHARARIDQEGLKALADEDGEGVPEGIELLDLLRQFPSARPEPEQLVSALRPIQPRLYSISSSPRAHPNQVHLTVGVVRYANSQGRQCSGVASTYLAERLTAGTKARIFVQSSDGFRLPEDGKTPVIMIGPGTGIAPFRAFLQDRRATGSTGKNWLFFGDQRKEFDYLYEQEISEYHRDGLLSRVDLAFSRDQAEKVYVQTRMAESAADLWAWLKEGAHVYVCGDAKRMAKDVDETLKQIIAEQGGMTPEQAKTYVADLGKAKRYQRDVY
jgi:sulfite reductase (NADPH) flavoprotein alpha-component